MIYNLKNHIVEESMHEIFNETKSSFEKKKITELEDELQKLSIDQKTESSIRKQEFSQKIMN